MIAPRELIKEIGDSKIAGRIYQEACQLYLKGYSLPEAIEKAKQNPKHWSVNKIMEVREND